MKMRVRLNILGWRKRSRKERGIASHLPLTGTAKLFNANAHDADCPIKISINQEQERHAATENQ